MTFQVLHGRTDELVQVFGAGMTQAQELIAVSNSTPEHLGTCLASEGALAFQLVRMDVLTYRRDDNVEQTAMSDPYDPSGIYYLKGFFLPEKHRLCLGPSHQEATGKLLREHAGELCFVVVPEDKGHRILPFWNGDVLLEQIPIPKHFPRAIDYLWLWPPGQSRFGFSPSPEE